MAGCSVREGELGAEGEKGWAEK